MNILQKQKKKVFALITIASLCFSSPFTYILEAETVSQKQKDLENNLNELNKDKDTTGKNLSSTTVSLEATMKEISTVQQKLALAKVRENGQYELMKKRIKYIYETGSTSFLTMLMESESMADLLNKADFIVTVSEYDRNMLEKLQKLHLDITKKEKALRQKQKVFEQQKKELNEKYKQLSSKITDTSNELTSYKEQLKKAEELAKQTQSLLNKKPEGNRKPEVKPNPPSVAEDLALFAGILECEAGSTDYNALLAVATVIMNRIESPKYPNTLSGVIYQNGQFSPTWTGKLDKVLNRGPKQLCYQVAQDALSGARYDPVRNCYSFHASYTGHEGIVVGDNVFF
ncbi:cell wall hydrolase [Faecalimonas sp.]